MIKKFTKNDIMLRRNGSLVIALDDEWVITYPPILTPVKFLYKNGRRFYPDEMFKDNLEPLDLVKKVTPEKNPEYLL